VCDDIVAEIAE